VLWHFKEVLSGKVWDILTLNLKNRIGENWVRARRKRNGMREVKERKKEKERIRDNGKMKYGYDYGLTKYIVVRLYARILFGHYT